MANLKELDAEYRKQQQANVEAGVDDEPVEDADALKAKRAETQRKQAERRTASSEKAKAKSDAALEGALATSARLRELKNGCNKRAREQARRRRMSRSSG